MATELQKGFGAALLRRSSPEGKLIAELRQKADCNLQVVDATLTTAMLKALPGSSLLLLPSPGTAAWYDVAQVDTVFIPGSDAGSDPLVSQNNAPVQFGLEGPYGLLNLPVGTVGYNGTDLAYNGRRLTGNGDLVASLTGLGLIVFITDAAEVITGNAAGDAKLHLRLYYRVRNLDF